MTAIVTVGLLTFFVGSSLLVALPNFHVSPHAITQSLLFLCVLLALASLNFEFGIFEQKDASELAFEIHQGGDYFSSFQTFALQALLNAPAFVLTGEWQAAIGTNAAIAALFFLVCVDQGVAAKYFILAPAVINFSLFALRDPLIGATLFAFTTLVVRRSSRGRTLGLIAVGLATYYTRPENLIIEGVILALVLKRRSSSAAVGILTVPAIIGSLYAALRFGPRLLGVRRSYSITEAPLVLEDFFNRRSERGTLLDGNDSAILGGRLPSIPFPIRFPIQAISFVLLPLPWEIRTLSMLFAFGDSLFLLWVVAKYRKRVHPDALMTAAVFVLVSALFSSNYGNSFRLRLPVYYILAAGARVAGTGEALGAEPARSRLVALARPRY